MKEKGKQRAFENQIWYLYPCWIYTWNKIIRKVTTYLSVEFILFGVKYHFYTLTKRGLSYQLCLSEINKHHFLRASENSSLGFAFSACNSTIEYKDLQLRVSKINWIIILLGFIKKHIIIIFRKLCLFSSGCNQSVFQYCYISWLSYCSHVSYPEYFILLYCFYAQCNSPLFITPNLKYRQKYVWYAKNLQLWQNYFRQYYIGQILISYDLCFDDYRNGPILE